MWACGIGTMKTEKISLKIFVRNSTKKKNSVHKMCHYEEPLSDG